MWYDETYDFGSFSNVLSRHPSGDGKLKFLIELELPKNNCPDTGCEECFIYEEKNIPFLKDSMSCCWKWWLMEIVKVHSFKN